MTRATWCTLIRVILAPLVVLCIVNERWTVSAILFCIAAITDIIDGALARWYNEQTAFGAWFDTIADKLLVLPTLIALIYYRPAELVIPREFFGLMASKEIIIALGALLLSCFLGRFTVRPTVLGKVTIFSQMVLIGLVLLMAAFNCQFEAIIYWLMGIVGIFIIITSFHYGYQWIRILKMGRFGC